jgi:metal-dependent amidase/aminoacylase/carboxypeptidase family protein
VFYTPPKRASEYFAFFTSACPGSIISLGCSDASKEQYFPLHSPYFDIDEWVLDIGVDFFYEAVRQYLAAGE